MKWDRNTLIFSAFGYIKFLLLHCDSICCSVLGEDNLEYVTKSNAVLGRILDNVVALNRCS